MKYSFIKLYSSIHRIQKMCQVLQVSRSRYYQWLEGSKSQRTKENEELLEAIMKIHSDSQMENYGSPRITTELLDSGFSCSIPRVARIMKANNIKSKIKRKFKVTTDSDHNKEFSPNLLQQDFAVDAPNKVWVSDLTYVWTYEGWLYLTTVIDLFHRKIVGWAMSNRMHSAVTTEKALEQAYKREHPSKDLIFHSDRGIQYASDGFRDKLSAYEMIQSMSGKGNCYDNAVAESFFKTIKTEHVYKNKYRTRKQARQSIFHYIEYFYNRFRRHSYLGNLSPEQFLNIYQEKKTNYAA